MSHGEKPEVCAFQCVRLRRLRTPSLGAAFAAGFALSARATAACARALAGAIASRSLLWCSALEGWPSGRRRTPGKCVYGKPYRGFESRPLRHIDVC